jgi:hypothetical protein
LIVNAFAEYQNAAAKIPVSIRNNRDRIDFPVAGLLQDAGKLGSLLATAFESGAFRLTPEQSAEVKDRMADILWYVARLCDETGISMESVAGHSLAQFQLRMKEFDPDQR